ncbi:hypothetical protein L226DRAFT_576852 [Lentinus tigrinus ALCF2SS1-7]|uniref:uncharacterized protein n=1 Tax=Lentinus tigrinus ALCF2SS1-7 TaxID=1328758 RepID=UPI001165F4DD|nr:hypothetical protein L226DRAFT_576852 [Lentinus tigrinus ALCF2SS1-7]
MSSSKPRPSEALPAPNRHEPWSMDHWRSCLITLNGTPLPRGTVAYAIGVAFPPENVRPIAEALCSPERIRKNGDNYLASLLLQLIEMDIYQTILHIPHPDTRERLIMWVLRVTPGRRGQIPTERIEDERWKRFYQYLYNRGVSKDVLRSFKMCITPWPQGAAYPVWVPDVLMRKLQKQAKQPQAVQSDKNTSKSSTALAAPPPSSLQVDIEPNTAQLRIPS